MATPFTLTAPSGFSLDSTGDRMYYTTPGGKLAILYFAQLDPQGQSGYQAVQRGKEVARTVYGINIDSLPQANPADMEQLAKTRNGLNPSNGMPAFESFNIADFEALKRNAGAAISETYNTDPSLGDARNPNAGYQPTAATPPKASTVAPPSVELQPGATGPEVKKLQDYLVSKGFMTQEEVNTGYGTYGPKTTAAVAKLQQALGVDNSTGVGYFGPKTMAAVQSTGGIDQSATGNTDLEAILGNKSLTDDQRAAIRAIYNAVETNDADSADRIKAAMQAASQYSDPYFKAQIRLALDALDRGLRSEEGDLAFIEESTRNALSDLKKDLESSKANIAIEHTKELALLSRHYEQTLSDTRDELASRGFTQSSKRARAEELLATENEGLVESSNRKFAYETGKLDRDISTNERDALAKIANAQRLAAAGKLDLTRRVEEQVGSDELGRAGYSPMGGVGGTIPRQQVLDATSFAQGFVF